MPNWLTAALIALLAPAAALAGSYWGSKVAGRDRLRYERRVESAETVLARLYEIGSDLGVWTDPRDLVGSSGRTLDKFTEGSLILGKTHAGKNYDDLRDSLDRLSETSIYAENAFYSKEDEDFRSHRFRMWSVHFSRKKRKGRASEHHTLRFDDILVRSYNASYLKSLDSDFYYGLKRPLARSLYKPVDVKRRDALSWSVELEGLRQLLSMPESYKYPSAIKRQLEPAHRELVRAGFLSRADFEERGRGATKANLVRYRVSQRFVRERSRPTPELSDGERFATDALVAKGVWPQAAKELVVKCGGGHCLHYIEAAQNTDPTGQRPQGAP